MKKNIKDLLLGGLFSVGGYILMKGKLMQYFNGSERAGQWFHVDDFLISHDFPQIKNYRLTPYQFSNLLKLTEKLNVLVSKYGLPKITSGGRPREVGDFVTALRKRGYSPASPSAHDEFAAVDLTWGPEKNKLVHEDAKKIGFLQNILYKDGSFLHLAIKEDGRELPYISKTMEKY